MRRWGTALAAIVLASAGLAATVTTANAATPAATTASTDRDPIWGSGDKTAEPTDYRPLENIRAGQHACFDRLVFDVRGTGDQPIGYRVGYVDELRQDGSGDLIKVGGGAILEVRATAPSYDPETGGATYQGRAGQPLPGVNLTGFKTFKDARFGSSFEGDTQIGLGVRARLPFRVTQTANHLVVDVAHSWTATR